VRGFAKSPQSRRQCACPRSGESVSLSARLPAMARRRPKNPAARRIVTSRARNLRRTSTDAERRMWSRLRDRRLFGLRFRRQQPCGPYIADFVCAEKKLIVEIDGGQHAERVEQDWVRTGYLEAMGYRVLRYWNNDVLLRTDAVLEMILREVGMWPPPQPGTPPHPNPRSNPLTPPSPLERGEGVDGERE
jgi:very-short-patch-repair endonuclease